MWKPILSATAAGLLMSGCTSSPPPRPASRQVVVQPAAAPVITAGVSITLSPDQAALVRGYVSSSTHAGNSHGRGRGHGNSGGLPPGIAKNLERGKSLPPGIAKGYLPSYVVADLQRLPTGLDYVVVAGKLLLVEAATAAIHDVLLDIAFDR